MVFFQSLFENSPTHLAIGILININEIKSNQKSVNFLEEPRTAVAWVQETLLNSKAKATDTVRNYYIQMSFMINSNLM